jgi:hypothetical protein
MSTTISGRVVAIPVATIAIAPIAALAAIGGMISGGVFIGAKGLVWCGNKIAKVCKESAERRRAIYLAAVKAEERLSDPPSLDLGEKIEAWRAEQEEEALRFKAWEALREAPPKMKKTFFEPLKISDEEPREARVITAASLLALEDKIRALREDCSKMLEEFSKGQWQGLFDTKPLYRRLANTENIKDLLDAEVQLRSIRRDLKAMAAEAPAQWAARKEAIEAIMRADKTLDELFQSRLLQEHPELASLVDLALLTSRDAKKALKALRFEEAKALAESASRQVEHLLLIPEEARKRNLEFAIRAVEKYLDGFGDFPKYSPLKMLVEEAKENLERNLLSEAWLKLREAEEGLEQIEEEGLTWLQAIQQAEIASHAKEALAEMGYEVREEDGNYLTLIGRSGEKKLYVTIGPDARMRIDLRNFDESCRPEALRFMKKLGEKGVLMTYETEFKMESVIERLRQILFGEGFEIISEEPTEKGVNIVAIKGNRCDKLTVNWDGELETLVDSDSSPKHGELLMKKYHELLTKKKRRLKEIE